MTAVRSDHRYTLTEFTRLLENLGTAICATRHRRGLTIEQVCEELDYNTYGLMRVERGEKGMNLRNLIKILRWLDEAHDD
jgi:transcriptional regulator with XRE-family HTH domain